MSRQSQHRAIIPFIIFFVLTPLFIGFQNFSSYQYTINRQVRWSNTSARDSLISNGTLTVPQGIELIYDAPASETYVITKLVVRGYFHCDETAARTLNVRNVLLEGSQAAFVCGKDSAPMLYDFKIQFKPLVSVDSDNNIYGSFLVSGTGTVSLVGKPRSAWTRLGAPATQGQTTITLNNRVNWIVGDEIAIASSGFNSNRMIEVLRILSIQNATITNALGVSRQVSQITFTNLKPGLPSNQLNTILYNHYGGADPETHSGATLENRAEVALLTRGITVQSELATCPPHLNITDCQRFVSGNNPAVDLSKFNGPDIKFGPGAVGEITLDQVAFRGMGKMGKMGKYPIHWHHAGATTSNRISNSVVRDSFNRCVTIHQTHNIQLQNNTCFNHFGHGFFLEDGNEINNSFSRNLGFGSKKLIRGYSLLASDVEVQDASRFAAPATFWISNPYNSFTNNVAAGSDAGTGFWFALKDDNHKPRVLNPNTNQMELMAVAPNRTAVKQFINNLAHSNEVGFSIDGGPNGPCFDEDRVTEGIQENPRNPGCSLGADSREGDYTVVQTQYTPPVSATFSGVTAYKNMSHGFWTIGQNNFVQNSVFADNLIAITLVFSSTLKNSTIIGQSHKFTALASASTVSSNLHPNNVVFSRFNVTNNFKNRKFSGVELYDGPFSLQNVKFVNFNRKLISDNPASLNIPFRVFPAASNRSTTNQVQGLSFVNDANHPREISSEIRADFFHNFGHPSKDNWSAALIDLDGSFFGDPGMAGYSLLPKDTSTQDSFINYPNCSTPSRYMTNALACRSKMGLMFFAFLGQFNIYRKNLQTNESAAYILPEFQPIPNFLDYRPSEIHQFSYPLETATQYKYQVVYSEQTSLRAYARQVYSFWMGQNQVSPLIEVVQKMHHCRAFSNSGSDIFKASGDSVQFQMRGQNLMHYGFSNNYSGNLYIQCDVPSQFNFASDAAYRDKSFVSPDGDTVIFADGGYAEALVRVEQGRSLTMTAGFGENRGIAQIYVMRQMDPEIPAIFGNTPTMEKDMRGPGYTVQEFTLGQNLEAGYYRVRIVRSGRTTGPDKFIVPKTIQAR